MRGFFASVDAFVSRWFFREDNIDVKFEEEIVTLEISIGELKSVYNGLLTASAIRNAQIAKQGPYGWFYREDLDIVQLRKEKSETDASLNKLAEVLRGQFGEDHQRAFQDLG